MINLFKDVARPIYQYMTQREIRSLSNLLGRRRSYKRYELVNGVRFLDFIFDVPDFPSFTEQFKELFVDENYKFVSQSLSPVIIDCGANIGTSCMYFKTLYPRSKIIAFEADEKMVKILNHNLKNNNINDVDVIGSAVWIHNNGVEFSSEGADGGSIQGHKEKRRVDSVRLRDVLLHLDKVDMLKIDIEGAEYEVIKDCQNSLDNVDNLFIKYHSWNGVAQNLSQLLEILEKNNFRYYVNGVCSRSQPFVNRSQDKDMDLQLNIFCTRLDK